MVVAKYDLSKVKADLASEKRKRETEAARAREELVEAKREAKAIMKKYKTSLDFAAKKVHMVVAFRSLKEISDHCITFNQEAFEKGYELGRFECRTQVTNRY